MIGTFNMIEAPTGNADRGLGVGATWYRLPVWMQKDWNHWTTYGGGGFQVVTNLLACAVFRRSDYLRLAKKDSSSAAHSSARTPEVISRLWFNRGSLRTANTVRTAPPLGSSAP